MRAWMRALGRVFQQAAMAEGRDFSPRDSIANQQTRQHPVDHVELAAARAAWGAEHRDAFEIAEQRIATFVLNLSLRFAQRGFSPREFILRMTREEIGNYLGLKLETVSRTFSKLQEEGVIAVEQKRLRIEDAARLRDIAGATCAPE